MTKKPKINICPKQLKEQLEKEQHPIWHTLHCKLITPMYGGGTISTQVDKQMPIRASAIRGQLRFWWRLLAKYKWKLGGKPDGEPKEQLGDDKVIRTKEFELWGGVSDGNDDGKAGKVLLRVTNVPNSKRIENNLVEYTEYIGTQKNRKLEYILFPASNADDRQNNPHKLLNPNNITWDLQFAFSPSIYNIHQNIGQDKPNPKEQIIETLRWWANFGGLGFRSRKGLGAVYVSQCQDFLDDYSEICQPLTPDDVAQAGCWLVVRKDSPTDGLRALQTAVQKLSDFRQKAGVGRNLPSEQARRENKPAGRSRWSEPDALRRIKNTHHHNHESKHEAGNVFARAVFGLPIIYHFVGRGEPSDTTVEPAFGERLASPLILRPIYAGEHSGQKRWRAGALLLPYQHILEQEVTINGENYPIWQDDTAQHIQPVHENGGIDPLQAFLTYFAR